MKPAKCAVHRLPWLCCWMLLLISDSSAQTPVGFVQVADTAGEAVVRARVTIHSANGSLICEGLTTGNGTFDFPRLDIGTYLVTATASGFSSQHASLTIGAGPSALRLTLHPAPVQDRVTVTARRGSVEETEDTPLITSTKTSDEINAGPVATIGNVVEGSPGILVQQSTYGQVSPFLRGLTGYQVLNLIDGVRFTNSTFRSGPNQYLALIEPGQAHRIEAVLGPSGAHYGSDSLGGTINVLTLPAIFGGHSTFGIRGALRTFAASADASGGGRLNLDIGVPKAALLLGGSWKRHNDLRAGSGFDSHHVFRRFFDLPPESIKSFLGSQQQDTGFTQYGWQAKLAARLSDIDSLTLWYQRSVMEGVRGYKDLWGGLGRLQSDFEPQELHFAYVRYERLRLGRLDSLSSTFSINSQRDGTIRQGLKSTDRITADDNLVNAFGYAAQAASHLSSRQAVVFGGEIYDEYIRARRTEIDPVRNSAVEKRALYPNGSRYTTAGLFAQHTSEFIHGKLRSNVSGRLTRVKFRSFADRNRTSAGSSVGVTDAAESFGNAVFNAALTWRATQNLNVHLLTGRGFRAPNLNDLGAIGLNDLGYEIPASEASAAGGLVGQSDGEDSLSSGRRITGLRAETLLNYELGIVWRQERLYARAQVFDSELKDPIVRRTLLFSTSNIPAVLAGVAVQPVAATADQKSQAVVTVATSLDPRAVKAFVNDGKSKYYGVEGLIRYSVSRRWSTEADYTLINGRELNPNRFIRRLPPQQGVISIRYQPGGRMPWLELSSELVGAQKRLSGGDLTDERIGAARRRRDIADFFRGSLVRGLINAGGDGRFGTSDDLFRPTGETLSQITDRVLPVGASVNGVRIVDDNTRVPLFLRTPGHITFHLRGGMQLVERVGLNFALVNLLDKNYRVHGSGIDAPGINLFIGLRYMF